MHEEIILRKYRAQKNERNIRCSRKMIKIIPRERERARDSTNLGRPEKESEEENISIEKKSLCFAFSKAAPAA